MTPKQLLTGDPGRTGLVYIAIGGISLVKAIALRGDSTRFRREIADAALFIGVGLVLRRYATMREQKRDELESIVPDWLLEIDRSGGGGGLREQATGRFRSEAESDRETSIADRARRMMAD